MSPSKRPPEPYEWSGIPDVLGYIRGARVWKIEDTSDGPLLRSVVRPVFWVPGKPVEAHCEPFGPGGRGLVISSFGGVRHVEHVAPCQQPPQPECRCGVWGTYDYMKVDAWQTNRWRPGRRNNSLVDGRLVGGAIQAWGRVVEGGVGFRAQFAQPIVLSYQGFWGKKGRGMVEQLAERYDLPISDRLPTFDKPE